MTETKDSSWGLLYYSNEDALSRCEDLVGKHFSCFTGEGDKIVVSCDDGSYIINPSNNAQLFWQEPLTRVSAGKSFLVGINTRNRIFSWGVEGDNGQLGHGASLKKVFEPLEIQYQAEFKEIVCGEAFSIALDTKGMAYAWGENFDRQLGIYSKSKEKMHLSNAMVEEVVFKPKLIPLSMQEPFRKVACGARFTLALTQAGKLYSWGAGESGQLGTGRCTRREVAEEVKFPDSNSAILDIAGGSGHSLALLQDGTLYAWGLNHRGQCGLGDIKARHFPVKITAVEGVKFVKVFADGHSSAAIDNQGKLWTWGSITNGRLLHQLPAEPIPDADGIKIKKDMTIQIPTQVKQPLLADNTKVDHFIFSRERSAVFIKTTVTDIWPKKGPKRTFSKLTISGYGFWEAPQIIIKFTAKNYSIYNPPRSCIGRYVSPTQLVCKPPKFAETGFYTVQVSLDGGKEFLPQTFDVLIYKDMSLLSQSPSIIDLRQKAIDSLILKASALRIDIQDLREVFVKLLFYGISDNEPQVTNNLSTPSKRNLAAATQEKTPLTEIVVSGTLSLAGANLEELGESVEGAATNRSNLNEEVTLSIRCSNIDLSEQAVLFESGGICELQCAISMNSQDFAAISTNPRDKDKETALKAENLANLGTTAGIGGGGANSNNPAAAIAGAGDVANATVSTICHTFTPHKSLPNFYSLNGLLELNQIMLQDKLDDAEKNINLNEYNPFNPEANLIVQQREEKYHKYDCKVFVQGDSFFPNHKLPKGAHIKLITSKVHATSLPAHGNHHSIIDFQSAEHNILIDRHEIAENLQDLLIHCENKHSCFFVINYHYLQELYQLLAYKLSHPGPDSHQHQHHQPDPKAPIRMELANYFISLHFEFYLESSSSEKLLLTKDELVFTLSKELSISLEPPLLRKLPLPPASRPRSGRPNSTDHHNNNDGGDGDGDDQNNSNDNNAVDLELITMKPKELLGFPIKPTVYSAQLIFPKIQIEGHAFDVPPYVVDSNAVYFDVVPSPHQQQQQQQQSSEAVSEEKEETPQEEEETKKKEEELTYYHYSLSIPSFPGLLSHIFGSLPAASLPANIQESKDLIPFLKNLSISFAFSENQANSRALTVPLYYYSSLSTYTLQAALPKGGVPAGGSVSLVLEEFLPASTSLFVRLRGNDETKSLLLPGNLSEVTNPTTNHQQTVVSFTVPDAAKMAEAGPPVMNGKEKTFYVDMGLAEHGATPTFFDRGHSPILVVK